MFDNLKRSSVFVSREIAENIDADQQHTIFMGTDFSQTKWDPAMIEYLWFDCLSGSDYSMGALANRINCEEVMATLENPWPRYNQRVIIGVSGDYGTFGVLIHAAEVTALVHSMENPHPWHSPMLTPGQQALYDLLNLMDGGEVCLNDMLEAEREQEAIQAAWDDLRGDFLREIERLAGEDRRQQVEALDATAQMPAQCPGLWEFFEVARDRVGAEWTEQSGGTYWVDVDKVAQYVVSMPVEEIVRR